MIILNMGAYSLNYANGFFFSTATAVDGAPALALA
jgi:hypothetical protein